MRKEVVSGVELYVRDGTQDLSIAKEVIAKDCYGVREIVKKWKSDRRYQEKFVAIDIGGHIGSFSAFLASVCDEAVVYSFEPDENNFKLLTRNTSKFGQRVIGRMNAVGDVDASVPFYTAKDLKREDNTGYGSAVRFPGCTPSAKAVMVKASSVLSEAAEAHGHIDMVKMDCEGGETAILGELHFSGKLQLAHMYSGEYHFQRGLSSVVDIFQSAGYRFRIGWPCNTEAGYFVAKRTMLPL